METNFENGKHADKQLRLILENGGRADRIFQKQKMNKYKEQRYINPKK